MDRNKGYYPNDQRFTQPKMGGAFENPYDMSSEEIQDLKSRGIVPVVTRQRISLTAAGSQEINVPGRAVVVYGHDGSAIKTVNTTAYVEFFFENQIVNLGDGFPAKHARGFRGPFTKVTLAWPAQNGVYVDVVILKSYELPWIDGESPT